MRRRLRRRGDELRRSLDNPHPGQGLQEWTRGFPEEDAAALVDSNAGKPIRWVSGRLGGGTRVKRRSVDKRRVRSVFGELARQEIAAIDEGLTAFLGLGERLTGA